jgi:hypothetical protein
MANDFRGLPGHAQSKTKGLLIGCLVHAPRGPPKKPPQPRALREHGKAFPHHTSSDPTTRPHPLSQPHHSHPLLPLTLSGPPGQVVAHKFSTPHLCRCYDPAQCDAEPCEAARARCTEQLFRDRSLTKLIAANLIIISSIGAPDTLLPTSIRHVYEMDPNHFLHTYVVATIPLRAMQSPARQQGQNAQTTTSRQIPH